MKGFTLIEILIVIFLVGLISIVIGSFSVDIFSLSRIIGADLSTQQEIRVALKQISSELRSASQSSSGSYPIAEASSTSLTFYSDIDDDGLKERLRYFLQNSIVKKGTLKPTGNPLVYNSANETVVDLVRGVYATTTPIFSYYNSAYDGESAPMPQPVTTTTVRLIKIIIMAESDPSKAPAPFTLTTEVTLRNIKDNL